MDLMISWLIGHKLAGVGGLAVTSVPVGLLLVPRVEAIVRHGHARC